MYKQNKKQKEQIHHNQTRKRETKWPGGWVGIPVKITDSRSSSRSSSGGDIEWLEATSVDVLEAASEDVLAKSSSGGEMTRGRLEAASDDVLAKSTPSNHKTQVTVQTPVPSTYNIFVQYMDTFSVNESFTSLGNMTQSSPHSQQYYLKSTMRWIVNKSALKQYTYM